MVLRGGGARVFRELPWEKSFARGLAGGQLLEGENSFGQVQEL